MDKWNKRLQVALQMIKQSLRTGGKQASQVSRRAGGRWIPSAMRGLASGLAGASKALNSGAKKLRKNVKTFAEFPNGTEWALPQPVAVPVPVRWDA